MQKQYYFHIFGLFIDLGVPPNFLRKSVSYKFKKVENHCINLLVMIHVKVKHLQGIREKLVFFKTFFIYFELGLVWEKTY